MSMLAEPRPKVRYCLQPKGKPLYNDPNNFGTKMLEKMGWSKGKGLGKNEDGHQEFVRVQYKRDIKGLGFNEEENQWTIHEEQFENLLNSLNNSENDCFSGDQNLRSISKNSLIKVSGESLEQKSKKSRARVHYKKFTMSKDLSQYSEKDLANIFGKKLYNSGTNIMQMETTTTSPTDITAINSKVSIQDYFKIKMEEKKKRFKRKHFETELIKYNVKLDFHENKKVDDTLNVQRQSICVENNTRYESHKKFAKNDKSHRTDLNCIVSKVEKKPKEDIKNKKKKKKEGKAEQLDNAEEKTLIQNMYNNRDFNGNSKCLEDKISENAKIDKKNKTKNKNDRRIKLEQSTDETETIFCSQKLNTSCESDNSNKVLNLEKLVKSSNKCIKNNINGREDKNQDINIKELHLKGIQNSFYDEGDIYSSCDSLLDEIQISQFCAEKFRHTNLDGFRGSNLKNLSGYGLKLNCDVSVMETPQDIEQIKRFWTNSYDLSLNSKYALTEADRAKIYKYKVKEARKQKKKIPDINVKHLKKRSVFRKINI